MLNIYMFLRNKILGAGIVLSLAVSPLISSGQMNINMPYTLSNELGVEIVPTYPRPNEPVSIFLTMYTEDLNSATITWYKDGKSVLSGKGETKYSFQVGKVGEEAKIEIQIKLLNGSSFSKNLDINPASIDLVFETDSYVPPFYKGKALHPRQGTLKIVAMPEFVKNGRRIAAKNLVYKWSNDVEVYQNQSGYGKNVLILNGSILGKKENVEVAVTDPVNNLAAYGYISINPVNPEIVFYENSPYYGNLFDTAITNTFNLKADEIQIVAAPYYFTEDRGSFLKYEWRLNNKVAPDLTGSRTAIFKKPEEERGKSSISLKMENTNRILQQAEGNLIMKFED